MAAAAGELDRRCRDCFVTATVDESPEQTAAVVACHQQLRAHGPATEPAVLCTQQQNLQRALQPHPISIPFLEHIIFPMTNVRHRDEYAAFLTLIESSALLHQYQRSRTTAGAIIATEDDFHIARRCAEPLFGSQAPGLSRSAVALLRRLFADGHTHFCMRDLTAVFPDWTRYAYRAALTELIDFGYIEPETTGGRGRTRWYHVTGRSDTTPAIRLREATVAPAVGELANVGDGASPTVSIVGRAS